MTSGASGLDVDDAAYCCRRLSGAASDHNRTQDYF